MKIDVIVPIYNAFDALINCLKSLEKNQSEAENIILINDASTDERILPYLYEMRNRNAHWHIIDHKQNQGFVKTANEGLKHSQNHSLLLNSDTIVSSFWLKAFKQAIESNETLATATAWSNNAEICSFPSFLKNNDVPEHLEQFATALYQTHCPEYPILPTAVGFCMLITQQAKQKVGYFDQEQFGHGYGEENDYSLRCQATGLKNILCDNAYVVHIGNVSFNDLGLQPDQASMSRLLEKHPDYLKNIQAYIEEDPLNALRNKILLNIKNHNQSLYETLIANTDIQIENREVKEDNKLAFTGERFTPECVREIWYEHYHRYAFTKRLIGNKKILDAACGEGYGSFALAKNAKHVTGLDIDSETITHAKNRYQQDNLEFVLGSCTDLPFENDSFDVIVSFETLEHLAEQQHMLKEFDRVLKKDGYLIISTPDKKHYSDATGFENEYHVKELYQHEFKELLNQHWPQQTWYSQAMAFHSMLERMNTDTKNYASDILDQDSIHSDKKLLTPMYYVVIAAKHQKHLPETTDLHLFADQEQSVYEHYNQTIRDYISVAEKYMALKSKHEKWLSTPILGKIIKFLQRGK